MECFGGSSPIEYFAGSCVEFGGDGVEVGLGVRGEVGALGQVLAQQPVGRSYVCQVVAGLVGGGGEAAWMRR